MEPSDEKRNRKRRKKNSRASSVDSKTPNTRPSLKSRIQDAAVAGPSTERIILNRGRPSNPRSGGAEEDIIWGETSKNTDPWMGSFTTGDDFIAFEPSSEDERPAAQPREWDRRKEGGEDTNGRGGSHKRRRVGGEFDQNDGYANKKQRVDAAARKAPWAADVDWDGCNNVAEMLHQEVDAFIRYISPTPVEHEVRSMTVQLISNTIRQAYPDATVLPFGSFETKLYLPLGDIDLVIQSDSMAYSDKAAVLRSLANIVRRAGITDRVTIIAKAKVPIVKFVTTHGHFSVDISINQINGVTAGKMVNGFLSEMPALRGLILVTKSFLNQRSMNEVFSGGLGSYSIVCLAISFLQMHPKIRRGEIDPSKNLGVLVMEFFELYGRYFNYETTGISIRRGGSYFNKAQRGWLDFRKTNLLSIEDPGDISNDISRGSYGIYNVRQTFSGAYEILVTAAYLRAGIIGARRQGQRLSFKGGRSGRELIEPEDMSILSSVMGVTQATINHRRLVQEVYDKGTLHYLVGAPPKRNVPSEPRGASTNATRPQRAVEAESVRSAWGESDMAMSSDPEKESRLHERAESESRYDVDAQPARKRRRTGKSKDMHTVFTTDEDEDEDEDDKHALGSVKGEDSFDEEHREYDLDVRDQEIKDSASSEDKLEKGRIKIDRNRAYWASKALLGGSGTDDS